MCFNQGKQVFKMVYFKRNGIKSLCPQQGIKIEMKMYLGKKQTKKLMSNYVMVFCPN